MAATAPFTVDFSTTTSKSKITGVFAPNYSNTTGNWLNLSSFHFSSFAATAGAEIQIQYTLPADSSLSNGTVVFTSEALRGLVGSFNRVYTDGIGIYIPGGNDVWLNLPGGNVSGGFKVSGDFEFGVH